MSWTKRQLVEQAHVELGLSSYAYNLQPRQQEDAMIKMDAMVAGWETSGIRIGYPLPSDTLAGDLDQETEIDIRANEAIYLNLAMKLAPAFGKVVSNETRVGAKHAYNRLLNRAAIAKPLKRANDSLSGAGNRYRHYGYGNRNFLVDEESPDSVVVRDETELD